MHSTTQKYKSWILYAPDNIWVPPCAEPNLTQQQIDEGYDYEWDEDLYQENGAMGNPYGWVLTKK
jgi:hypothetical protein